MARREGSVADAEAEVNRLEQAGQRWRAEAETKSAELAALESSHGDRVLDGADPRELHAKAEDLRILVAGAQSAAESADRKLVGARAEVIRAQGREVAKRAQAAERAAAEHNGQLEVLLTKLRDLEGVDYEWAGPPPGAMSWTVPQSHVLTDTAAALTAEAKAIEERAGDTEVGVFRPLSSYLPTPIMTFMDALRR